MVLCECWLLNASVDALAAPLLFLSFCIRVQLQGVLQIGVACAIVEPLVSIALTLFVIDLADTGMIHVRYGYVLVHVRYGSGMV